MKGMKTNQDLPLISESGYSMPFDGSEEAVMLERGYGLQDDGSFSHGISLKTNRYVLKAVADGLVSSIGASMANRPGGISMTMRHSDYEVVYGGLSHAVVGFGKKVKAGDPVAISGNSLFIEVRANGKETDPIGFLQMLLGLVMTQDSDKDGAFPRIETRHIDIPTDYDDCQEEVEELMLRHYREYLMEIAAGLYTVPVRTEQSLRNIFTLESVRKHFYDCAPSLKNPLGLSDSAAPIAAKVQNLLIGDFLSFLALRHGIVLSALDEIGKKKEYAKQKPSRD